MGANPCSGSLRLRLARESLTDVFASLGSSAARLQSHRNSPRLKQVSPRLVANGSESVLWIASPSARSRIPDRRLRFARLECRSASVTSQLTSAQTSLASARREWERIRALDRFAFGSLANP